jgi:two-component system sensor histidine kinase UhpB
MMNILIIEDNDDTYLLLANLLKDTGFQIKSISRCTDIKEVLEHTTQVDIILTDLALPDSAGMATFKRVSKKFPNIPILVLTGSDELDVALKTIQLGAQDYLIKGEFDAKILGKAIQYSVERKKLLNDYRRTFMESPRQCTFSRMIPSGFLMLITLPYASMATGVKNLSV